MIPSTDFTGLLSTLLFISTLASFLIPNKPVSISGRLAFLCLSIGFCLIPFWSLSIAYYVRGLIGDLSIPNLAVQSMTLAAFVSGTSLLEKQQMRRFCFVLLPIAIVFYPLSMGLGKYDPYALGYGSPILLAIVFFITLLAWFLSYWFIAISLSLSVFCYAIGWYESNNLWDYLIDPILVLYALGVTLKASMYSLPPLEKGD